MRLCVLERPPATYQALGLLHRLLLLLLPPLRQGLPQFFDWLLRIRQRLRVLVPAYVSIRQHTSAYVSIRQHTSYASAYVGIWAGFAGVLLLPPANVC